MKQAPEKKLSMFDDPAHYRYRAVELAGAREKLRQARDLARSAVKQLTELKDGADARLAELGADYRLDFKTEIACCSEAADQLLHAETNISFEIAKTPIV